MEEKEEEEEEAAPGPRGASLRPRPPLPVPPQEGELCAGGAQPAAQGGASGPDLGEEKAAPGHPLQPLPAAPAGAQSLPSPAAARKSSSNSPKARRGSLGGSPGRRRRSPGRSSPGRRSPSRSSPGRRSPGRSSPGRRSPGRRSPGRRSPGRKSPGRKSPGRKSPGRKSPGRKSPGRREQTRCPSPQAWRRSTLEGCRRKSLPPVHQEVTELSKSISKELPEAERLRLLLLASFQFSAQKLEQSLQQCPGFSPEAFRARVQSLTEDFKSYLQKLSQDGTLRGCVEEPEEALDPTLQDSVAQIKEHIARFTTECQAWDQLLQRYQEGAEDICRQLEECRRKEGVAEPEDYLQSSQAEVLRTKPNYQQILDEQGEVLDFMQLVLDELQQAVKLLQAFCYDSDRFLCGLSEQLAARRLQQLENSPVRKLLGVPPRKRPPPDD